VQVYEDQNKKVLKGSGIFFFIAKGYRVVCDTNEQKRGEVGNGEKRWKYRGEWWLGWWQCGWCGNVPSSHDYIIL
jgi:hypothetical protein